MSSLALEPWLTPGELAEHFGCSVRWVAYRRAEGMPHRVIGGKPRYRASEAEQWLEANGLFERRGGGILNGNNEDGPAAG